jgi:hypothetical protein
MLKKITLIMSLVAGISNYSYAQSPERIIPETNIGQAEYPCILPNNRVMFQIRAPQAQSIMVSLGNTALTKGNNGIWTGATEPLDPGFHYYQLIVDGVSVSDPASEAFYGTSKMSSAIEIPEKGVDFYTIKDVPHGNGMKISDKIL